MNKQTEFVIKCIADKNINRILNIGYRYNSDHTILNYCKQNNKEFIVLEAFKNNCIDIEKKKLCKVFNIDVRNIKNLNETFDFIIWLHGPEHISWDEFLLCKNDIEIKSKYGILYQAPIGEYPQDILYENKYEKHVQVLFPNMFKQINYNVEDYSNFNEHTFSAYKFFNKEKI